MAFENPYRDWVAAYRDHMARGKSFSTEAPPSPGAASAGGAPTALLLSPHPDDESIIGTLPLRLLRQGGYRVVNVAVTLGSRRDRRAARLMELADACGFLGFDLENAAPDGLENINPAGRAEAPDNWRAAVDTIARLIERYAPNVILMPHAEDWNQTHIGTHLLGVDALARQPDGFECWVVETEFWNVMSEPNLLVECSDECLADQMAAVALHVGEVVRNPYHLSLPAWMQDTVRRGAEWLAGQGGAAPDFLFAVLYRLRRWRGGALETVAPACPRLPADASPVTLFP